jgi:hypothetical protein
MAKVHDQHDQTILGNQNGTSLVQNIAILAGVALVIFFIINNKQKKQIEFLNNQKNAILTEMEYKISDVLKYEDQCGILLLDNLQGKILARKKQESNNQNVFLLKEIKNFQNEVVVKSNKNYQNFFKISSLSLELALEDHNELMLYEYKAQGKIIIELETCQSPLLNCSVEKRTMTKKEFNIPAMSIDVNQNGKILDAVCYRSEEQSLEHDAPATREIASEN